MNNKTNLIVILSVLITFISCNNKSRFAIDTNKNRVEVKIGRFDKDLLSIDTLHVKAGVDSLYARYPDFLPVFVANVLDTMPSDTAAVCNLIDKFLRDTAFTSVNKKALETFNDISGIEKKVSDAYTYIHYYFPEVQLPKLYFFVSGFNRAVLLNEDFIALGTDLYLGADFPKYQDISYEYLIYGMRPECVPTDMVSATLFRMFVMDSEKDRLLENMLFRGKIMYLQSFFMPDERPELLMGYKPEQWKWCTDNEKAIWGAIIDQKDLFSTDVQLINKYMNDAPFTSPISQDSPGRLGTWVGWQIIKSYMNVNKSITLKQLMDENDYQKILENSEYRP